jgi:hypothetical protein
MNYYRLELKLNLKLSCNRRSVGQRVLVPGSPLELITRFYFSVWQLWVSWYWLPSLTRRWPCNLLVHLQFLLGLARAVTLVSKSCRTHDHILLSDFRLHQQEELGPRIYIPQEQGSPVISTGTGLPFRRLLRLTGLRWRYSKPPSHWCKCVYRPLHKILVGFQCHVTIY